MRVEPGGAELLRVARAELLENLLPSLPESQRYAARMVANAMAIATREMESPSPDTSIDAGKLAAEIRAGVHDTRERSDPLLERLREITRRRLEVSNPRLVERTRT
jgi:hypothetical protein